METNVNDRVQSFPARHSDIQRRAAGQGAPVGDPAERLRRLAAADAAHPGSLEGERPRASGSLAHG